MLKYKKYVTLVSIIIILGITSLIIFCKEKEEAKVSSEENSKSMSNTEPKSKVVQNEKQAIQTVGELIQGKKYEDAVELLNEFIKNGNPSFKSYYYLAQIYYDIKNFDLALPNAEKANEILMKTVEESKDTTPNQNTIKWLGETHSLIALVNKALKKNDQAELYYQKAVKYVPNDANALTNFATFYFDTEKFNLALQYYEKALALNPTSEQGLSGIASTYETLKNNNKAIECYKKSIEYHPDQYHPYINLGNLYLDAGNKDEGNLYLGKGLFLQGKYDEAREALSNISKIDSKPEVLKIYISTLIQSQEFTEAQKYVKMGLTKYPNDEEFFYNSFQIYFQQKQFEEAKQELEKALKKFDNSSLLLSSMGYMLNVTGKKDEAITYFEKALTIKPTDISAREELAQIYREQGKVEFELFQQGVVYYYKKDYKNAQEVLQIPEINTFPDEYILQYYRGLVEAKLGNTKQAIKYFTTSIEKKNDFFLAYTNLATEMKNDNEKDKAIGLLNDYLKKYKDSTGSKEVKETLKSISK